MLLVGSHCAKRLKTAALHAHLMTGWLGVLGWQTGIAFSGYLTGTQIQGLLVLNYPG